MPDRPADSTGLVSADQLLQRLMSRHPGGELEIKRPKEKVPFPPIVPEAHPVITGRLIGHGPGSRPPNLGQASYFIDLLVEEGRRLRLWGADLKRALIESETNPKLDLPIGVQRIGYQSVRVPRPDGTGYDHFKRVRYRVERIAWFADQALQSRRSRNRLIDDREPPSM